MQTHLSNYIYMYLGFQTSDRDLSAHPGVLSYLPSENSKVFGSGYTYIFVNCSFWWVLFFLKILHFYGFYLFDKINNLSASLRCMKPAKVSKYKTHIKRHERWQLKYTKHNKILFFITHSTNPKIIKNKICQKLWKLEALAVKSNTCTGTWFSVKSNNYNIDLAEKRLVSLYGH